VWRGEVLIEGYLEIAPQATVTVAPGTTVRFRPTERGEEGILLVRGRLQAVGSREQKITFTSDEITPSPGDWQGIVVLDSSKKNLLEWCRIEAAATGIEVRFSDVTVRETDVVRCRTGMALRSSAALVYGGSITDCATGLLSSHGDSDVTGVRFSGNRRGIAVAGGSLFLSASEVTTSEWSAVEATGARLRLEGNSFVRNGVGVVVRECRGDLIGNRIEENRTVGLDSAGSPLRITGNRITGNGGAGVVIRSGGGTLWDNSLEGNGGYELINAGQEDVAAPGNWWGSADLAVVRGRIREGCADRSCGRVALVPLLTGPSPSGPRRSAD
jgi:parallel beta-helix repeat protein